MLITRDGDYQFFNVGTKAFHSYCVLYKDKAVLVDPGPLSERDAIEQNLTKDFIFAIDAIVLTHGHGDTAGNAEYFSMLFNCPVYCMKDSLEAVQHGIYRKPSKDHPYVKKAGSAGNVVFKLPAFLPFEGCPSAKPLTTSVITELLGKNVTLLMTPGHSADSISLRIGPVALIGDCAQYMKRVLAPVFVDDETQLANTWQTLLGLSCEYYLTSHGRAFSAEEWIGGKEEN
ncbi:MAG: MBL fold metallo-hydrolase [Clostridiales bacterium]|nr:MBL fold metallo-hydrolase [Clostridiales bacterium]